MLECTLVQDKPHILMYCVNLLASFTEGYFCKKTGFDVSVEYPLSKDEGNNENEEEGEGEGGYCGIKHKIEQHLVNGLPVFFQLLKDPNPQSKYLVPAFAVLIFVTQFAAAQLSFWRSCHESRSKQCRRSKNSCKRRQTRVRRAVCCWHLAC